jgi:hypothetical protein
MNRYVKAAVLLSVLCLSLAAPAAVELRAQERHLPVALRGVQYKVSRLAPGSPSGEAVFHIDRCGSVHVELLSGTGDLQVGIDGPAGLSIDASTVYGLGGRFELQEITPPEGSPLTRGFHYIFDFPWPGEGNYTVRFKAPGSPSRDVVVITEVTTDSSIVAKLLASESVLTLGTTAVLSAAVFDGKAAVAGADVALTARTGSAPPVSLTLRDDGRSGDAAAGDGLYSGRFVPSQPGDYVAAVTIKGTTAGGVSFTRQSTTSFSVVEPGGGLTRTVQDQGVDADRDGLFEEVVVDVQVKINRAGRYRAFVHLKTAAGQTLVRSGAMTLPTGTHNIRVKFDAAALHELGEDGPYYLKLIELVSLGETGAVPSGRIVNVKQTRDYRLTQYQRPALALTGVITDEGIDFNDNGLFDTLLVSVQVDVLKAGTYSWSFKLVDQNSHEFEVVSGRDVFAAGLNDIRAGFRGLNIGTARADGPYLLRDLLLFGPSASLVVAEVGRTGPYLSAQFESPNRPPVADAGADQVVECAGASGTPVLLDGSGSRDPDGNPLAFEWRDAAGNLLATTAQAAFSLPLGVHPFTLTVDDGRGGVAHDSVLVIVRDTTPPEVRVSLTPDVLWPSNNKLVPITAAVRVSDLCDPSPAVELVSITSSEPDAESGGKGSPGDIQGAAFGTGDREFLLRAARLGSGPGRTYTVTYRAKDASGNAATATAEVIVPHDQRHPPPDVGHSR